MIDIESILSDIETHLKANLNTRIAALNTEKNDSIVLKTVSDNAYFFQTLNDSLANYNPFLFYGLANVAGEGIGPGVVKTLTIQVIICIEDRGEDLFIGKRMLRYSRVLEDLFNSGWAKIKPYSTFKINSLVPVALTLMNSQHPYRAVGIDLITTLG